MRPEFFLTNARSRDTYGVSKRFPSSAKVTGDTIELIFNFPETGNVRQESLSLFVHEPCLVARSGGDADNDEPGEMELGSRVSGAIMFLGRQEDGTIAAADYVAYSREPPEPDFLVTRVGIVPFSAKNNQLASITVGGTMSHGLHQLIARHTKADDDDDVIVQPVTEYQDFDVFDDADAEGVVVVDMHRDARGKITSARIDANNTPVAIAVTTKKKKKATAPGATQAAPISDPGHAAAIMSVDGDEMAARVAAYRANSFIGAMASVTRFVFTPLPQFTADFERDYVVATPLRGIGGEQLTIRNKAELDSAIMYAAIANMIACTIVTDGMQAALADTYVFDIDEAEKIVKSTPETAARLIRQMNPAERPYMFFPVRVAGEWVLIAVENTRQSVTACWLWPPVAPPSVKKKPGQPAPVADVASITEETRRMNEAMRALLITLCITLNTLNRDKYADPSTRMPESVQAKMPCSANRGKHISGCCLLIHLHKMLRETSKYRSGPFQRARSVKESRVTQYGLPDNATKIVGEFMRLSNAYRPAYDVAAIAAGTKRAIAATAVAAPAKHRKTDVVELDDDGEESVRTSGTHDDQQHRHHHHQGHRTTNHNNNNNNNADDRRHHHRRQQSAFDMTNIIANLGPIASPPAPRMRTPVDPEEYNMRSDDDDDDDDDNELDVEIIDGSQEARQPSQDAARRAAATLDLGASMSMTAHGHADLAATLRAQMDDRDIPFADDECYEVIHAPAPVTGDAVAVAVDRMRARLRQHPGTTLFDERVVYIKPGDATKVAAISESANNPRPGEPPAAWQPIRAEVEGYIQLTHATEFILFSCDTDTRRPVIIAIHAPGLKNRANKHALGIAFAGDAMFRDPLPPDIKRAAVRVWHFVLSILAPGLKRDMGVFEFPEWRAIDAVPSAQAVYAIMCLAKLLTAPDIGALLADANRTRRALKTAAAVGDGTEMSMQQIRVDAEHKRMRWPMAIVTDGARVTACFRNARGAFHRTHPVSAAHVMDQAATAFNAARLALTNIPLDANSLTPSGITPVGGKFDHAKYGVRGDDGVMIAGTDDGYSVLTVHGQLTDNEATRRIGSMLAGAIDRNAAPRGAFFFDMNLSSLLAVATKPSGEVFAHITQGERLCTPKHLVFPCHVAQAGTQHWFVYVLRDPFTADARACVIAADQTTSTHVCQAAHAGIVAFMRSVGKACRKTMIDAVPWHYYPHTPAIRGSGANSKIVHLLICMYKLIHAPNLGDLFTHIEQTTAATARYGQGAHLRESWPISVFDTTHAGKPATTGFFRRGYPTGVKHMTEEAYVAKGAHISHTR
jgi:hypothetical protein